jgi:hypothetical protein
VRNIRSHYAKAGTRKPQRRPAVSKERLIEGNGVPGHGDETVASPE